MGEEGFNIFKAMARYDKRWVYLSLFVLVLAPMVKPIGMPIAVSKQTMLYYQQLETLKEGDIVLVSWATEFSGYMEIKPGMVASHKYFIEHGIKIFICFGHPECLAIVDPMFGAELKDHLEKYNYQYGEDYVILGFALPNVAATIAMVTDFQGTVLVDWKGNSIKGTFLDRVRTGADINMIADFTTAAGNPGLIDHIVLRFNTPMIQNPIGVMIPGALVNLDAGLLKGIIGSSRGGAELEYLMKEPGSGLIMMDSFTIAHYMLIIFIIIGNIGYFGWTRIAREQEKTAVR